MFLNGCNIHIEKLKLYTIYTEVKGRNLLFKVKCLYNIKVWV